MKRDKSLWVIFVALAYLWGASAALAQVSRPNPSATPKPDQTAGRLGVPRPSARPTCGDTDAFFFGDPQGCTYSCNDGRTTIVGGVTCVFPTAASTVALTPTPTVTVTPTATATATVTPTPTVTATP